MDADRGEAFTILSLPSPLRAGAFENFKIFYNYLQQSFAKTAGTKDNRMVTIKDVARRAGVSITTVSHVINQTRTVSGPLRDQVLQAMQELGYRPNTLARGLRRGETSTIGLVIPDNSNPYFAELARLIEDQGFNHGYSVILCNTDDNPVKERTYIEALLAKQVDGILFIPTGKQTQPLAELIHPQVPVVVLDREAPDLDAPVVLADNVNGGLEAVRYLLALGHRRIACITGPKTLAASLGRLTGYRQALEEAGIAVQETWIQPGNFRVQGGEEAMRQLLTLDPPPTAVFACNDVMAIGALRAVRTAGLTVPGDISIVGYDDIEIASAVIPALTTMAQPVTEMARQAVEQLLGLIHAEGQPAARPERTLLPARLVVRDSCQRISS